MSFLSGIWNWISGKQEILDRPTDLLFERDVSSDNDFWVIFI